MKFSTAVDSLTKENMNLRTTVMLLCFAVIFQAMSVLLLYDKAPLIIERSSHGLEIVQPTTIRRTEADVIQALRLMVKTRFDTTTLNPEVFLTSRQLELRDAEQQEMKSRGLTQGVLFRSAKVNKNEALVEFDRVISVGEIRSALKTVVSIVFEECAPNELNPYGLKLALVSPLENKENRK